MHGSCWPEPQLIAALSEVRSLRAVVGEEATFWLGCFDQMPLYLPLQFGDNECHDNSVSARMLGVSKSFESQRTILGTARTSINGSLFTFSTFAIVLERMC